MLSVLLLLSCRQEQDPVKYTENAANGLRKTTTVGDISYTIQYKPAAYILQQEHPEPAEREKRKKQLKGMAWFNIAISVPGFNQSPLRYKVSGLEEYTARQDYYLNRAAADMYLLYGNDTLHVNSYWFENNQNLATHETMLVGFKLPGHDEIPAKEMRLSFYDRVFQNGIIKAVIKKEDLAQIPDFK